MAGCPPIKELCDSESQGPMAGIVETDLVIVGVTQTADDPGR